MRRLAALVAAAALGGCSGDPVSLGLDEPIRVSNSDGTLAQFVEGKLPGKTTGTVDPQITSGSATRGRITSAGATGYQLNGLASTDAYSVAFQLKDAGSGYWLFPLGAPDDANQGQFSWSIRVDLAQTVPTGLQSVVGIAFDADGKPGSQFAIPFCIKPLVPDNLNACDDTVEPPNLVVSLDWDRPVDLDLKVVTPEGKIVDSKHPTTAPEDDKGKSDPTIPGTGILDRDSNRGCVIDGFARENLVFQKKPSSGVYTIYASLFDSCGESAVRYDLSTHVEVGGKEDGTFGVEETFRTSGALRAIDASGGKTLGAYVTQIEVQ